MKKQAGFTLIEIIMVLGILVIISGLSVVVNLDTYRAYIFRGERDLAIDALKRARSLAVSNVCMGDDCTDGLPHGVHFETGLYVIFQDSPYNPTDPLNEVLPVSGSVTVSGIPDVIFDRLSGDVMNDGSVILADQFGHTSTIDINEAGQVKWDF